MNKHFTLEALSQWVNIIKQCAERDDDLKTSVFPSTVDTELSIIAGWKSGFGPAYADLLCVSNSDPSLAMCIKIVKNPGFKTITQFAARDFDSFEQPGYFGSEEDFCIALELEDDPAAVAEFYKTEWERLTCSMED